METFISPAWVWYVQGLFDLDAERLLLFLFVMFF